MVAQRREIGIGIVGGGYMGKAHAVAMSAVGAVFETTLRPRLEMVAANSAASAERYRSAFGFTKATDDWRVLVADPKVEAVVIASPQSTHRAIAEAAFAAGKPVFCEKPLGKDVADSRAMVAAAEASGLPNMVGFNYIRTPASQFARKLIADGVIGDVTWFRGEHTEDFFADPAEVATWRCQGQSNGTMGDLAPHMINAALALIGPIRSLSAQIETVHTTRPGPDGIVTVTNDDQAQLMCRFDNGAHGADALQPRRDGPQDGLCL
jgi:predicted dehydrogenase